MTPQEKVVATFKNEVGYLEKASNSNLYSKTGNAGRNNYTKYAYELSQTDILNGNKNGYQWCTTSYIWCFYTNYGTEKTKKALYLPSRSLAAGCIFAVQYYKAAGKYSQTPSLGAQIFFSDSDGDPCHTGMVVGFDSNYVYTVEGNTSGASGVVANGGGVAQKSYSRNYSRIHGYGIPNWSVLQEEYKEGWQKNDKGWWYRYTDGSYPANQWALIANKWYWFDKEGYAVSNQWKYDNGKIYYLGSDGAMVINKSLKINDKGELVTAGNYYHLLKEVTYDVYRKPLDKLIAKGYIKGEGGEGEDLILNLPEEAVRMIVFLDRAGAFE